MDFGSFDGGEDGECNGVGLVEVSGIFAMQDDYFEKPYHLTEYMPSNNIIM